MKVFGLALIGMLMLCTSLPGRAQVHPCGGPGPGEVVVGQTETGNGLAPVPLCQSSNGVGGTTDAQAPALHWESRWGAIATDEPHGVLGSVTNMSSRRDAEKAAMEDCKAKGGENCKLETWYSNGCAALILGDNFYNVTAGTSIAQAIEEGMKTCSAKGQTGCHVYFKACSPPAPVR